MKIYGYCRVSTKQQNIERQIRNIKKVYPDAVIVTDEYSGTTLNRPEWMKLYKKLQSGDVVVFDQVSRMSRDAEEGYQLYEELYNKNIELIFLKEPHINTQTYKKALETGVPMTGTNVDFILEGINKYLLSLAKEQIQLAFSQAEKEVEDLHQRTREGIETARLNGKQIGQPKGAKLTTKKSVALKKLILEYAKDFNGKNTDAEAISIINGLEKIVYDTKVITKKNHETGKEEKVTKEYVITPHEGLTKSGNTKNRYINRATYYKYKRELKTELKAGD